LGLYEVVSVIVSIGGGEGGAVGGVILLGEVTTGAVLIGGLATAVCHGSESPCAVLSLIVGIADIELAVGVLADKCFVPRPDPDLFDLFCKCLRNWATIQLRISSFCHRPLSRIIFT